MRCEIDSLMRRKDRHSFDAGGVESCEETEAALQEYSTLAGYYPGAEARVRYAQLLERMEKPELARQEYAQILAAAELAPKHFRKAQKQWINQAKDGAARLKV